MKRFALCLRLQNYSRLCMSLSIPGLDSFDHKALRHAITSYRLSLQITPAQVNPSGFDRSQTPPATRHLSIATRVNRQ